MPDDAESVLREDPVLRPVIDRHELPPIDSSRPAFERLCVSIINQQLSTASARAVRERAFTVLDHEVTPQRVLDASADALRDAGLSRTKVEYLQHAATAFERHDYTREGLAHRSNEAVVEALTEIRGIGQWTAEMFLIFVLERPDVLPLGDLAVRRGIETLYADGDDLTRATMREIAEPWRPYRSVATRYIWAEYESE